MARLQRTGVIAGIVILAAGLAGCSVSALPVLEYTPEAPRATDHDITSFDSSYASLQIESNNRWADCATSNGWAVINDPDDDSTLLTVLLPGDITEVQLRILLRACPNFDPAMHELLDQWWYTNPSAEGYPEGYLPEPSIGFDTEGFGGDADWTPSPEELLELERINRLYEVLYEQMQAYWESQGIPTDTGPV